MELYIITMWFMIHILFLLFPTVDSKLKTECQLMFNQSNDDIKNLQKSAKLLTITVELTNTTRLPVSVGSDSDVFQPLQWKRVTGTHGKGLLQLMPIYEMLSLSLLSYETEKTSVTLKSNPEGCITTLTKVEYELLFRNFFLNFTKEDVEICNEHIENISGYANFYHECCLYDNDGKMQCYRVLKNKWMTAIHYCTYIVIVIVGLYCPLMIPRSLYDPKFGPKQFVYHLQDFCKITVKKHETKYYCKTINETVSIIRGNEILQLPYHIYAGMKKFKHNLKRLKIEDGNDVKVELSKIYFNFPTDEVVSANEVPIGLLKEFYDLFLKCGLRNQKGFSECCAAKMFGTSKCCKNKFNFQWYRFLRFQLRIVLSISLCLPWIIRVGIFYFYENEIRETRHKAAETRNLRVPIDNNFAYYGTPIHVLFIVSYACMCFGYIILELTSVILSKKVKSLVHKMLTTFFLGWSYQSKLKILQWNIKVLLKPFKIFGLFGVLIAVPCWVFTVPIISLISAYYFFPTVYIAVNFLCLFFNIFRTCKCKSEYFWDGIWCINRTFNCCLNDIWNEQNDQLHPDEQQQTEQKRDDQPQTEQNEPLQHDDQPQSEENELLPYDERAQILTPIKVGLMIVLLFSMLSALLLIAELVIFLIKVAIYTMVGLILNSSHAMQYVSTSSLAWLYYRRCFGGIGKIYKTYNKAVQTILYRISKQQVDETARKNKKEHEKTTLKVIHESSQGEDSDPIVGTYEHDETSEMDTRLSSEKSVHITPENDEYIIPSDQIGGGKEHKPKSERNANDGVLNFKTNGVILLLDQSDKQYITKQFFFKVCKIKPDGPGPWSKHFLVALRHFLIIFIFLVFVTLVVLAFGESYRVSFPNQLLATLAGGVVPWILMKTNLLFSQDDMPDAEELVERYFDDDLIMENEENGSNDKPLQHAQSTRLNKNGEVIVKGIFKKNFDKVIEKHEEWWTIVDMDFAGKLDENNS